MSQQQLLDFFKSNPPGMRFTAQDIIHSVKGGIRKERFYENIRKLERMDCIKKEKGCWYYEPTGKDKADKKLLKGNKD